MPNDDLFARVLEFVHRESEIPREQLVHVDLVEDGSNLYGDDLRLLLDKFGREFHVDLSGYRWYYHTGSEGCNPFWIFFKPWWARKPHIPIRISELVESARAGQWVIRYPEDEPEV